MTTLTVGQGQQFTTISAAVAASHDGDVVQVQAGTYSDDFITVNSKITLEGVGGMVHLQATDDIPNDRGIIVANNDLTLDHFEISGAKGYSGNDAGIRYQAGNLTVTNSYFHDNQNGILATPTVADTGAITIKNSEFFFNGNTDPNAGAGTHQIYIGHIAKLEVDNSYFHDTANEYNQIKSRAAETDIFNTRVFDGVSTDDWTSYEVDVAEGGVFRMENSVIVQGANSQNPTIVGYGMEGLTHATNSIYLNNNTIVNEMAGGRGVALNDPNNVAGQMLGTKAYDVSGLRMVVGANVTETGTTHLTASPALDTSHPWAASDTTTPPPSTTPPLSTPPSTSPVADNTADGTSSADVINAPADSVNVIRGMGGDDQITGGLQHNEINGNVGQDTIIGRSHIGDVLMGGQGNDLLDARASDAHNDLNGNKGADVIFGGAGGDSLHGGQGDDQVTGGSGADWISGDLGSNTLTGGQGADVFHGAVGGVSVVTDFDGSAGDRIQLDRGVGYHLSQQGADLHIVLDTGAGGELVLRNESQSAFSNGWILQG